MNPKQTFKDLMSEIMIVFLIYELLKISGPV